MGDLQDEFAGHEGDVERLGAGGVGPEVGQ